MSASENILLVFAGLGMLQGILLAAIVYFHPKSDRSVTVFLAGFIFSISVVMSTGILLNVIPWHKTYTFESYPLLMGCFLYLYIRSFKETITLRKAFPYLIPFLFYFLISYFYLNAMNEPYKNSKQVPAELLHHPVPIVLTSIKLFFFLFFYYVAYRALLTYQRSIQQLFSETSRIDLAWAKWLINGYLIIIIASIILYGLMLKYPEKFNLLILINVALGTPYIYLATFKGMMQPSLWQVKSSLPKEKIEQEMHGVEEIQKENGHDAAMEKPRYQKAGLRPEKVDDLVSRIRILMEQEKIYCEAELTLQDLAQRLQSTTHQVSQVINEVLKKNFYDLINSYRVEEAKRLLLDPKKKNYTIVSVGFDAGFNSKTTFNTVFKKFTGLTPTDYRAKQSGEPVALRV
jgi:AraC-like DNA-binding protein